MGLSEEFIASTVFLDRAERVLPIEDRYDYHKTFLKGSIHSLSRGPEAICAPDELEISAEGWKIFVYAECGPLTRECGRLVLQLFRRLYP